MSEVDYSFEFKSTISHSWKSVKIDEFSTHILFFSSDSNLNKWHLSNIVLCVVFHTFELGNIWTHYFLILKAKFQLSFRESFHYYRKTVIGYISSSLRIDNEATYKTPCIALCYILHWSKTGINFHAPGEFYYKASLCKSKWYNSWPRFKLTISPDKISNHPRLFSHAAVYVCGLSSAQADSCMLNDTDEKLLHSIHKTDGYWNWHVFPFDDIRLNATCPIHYIFETL